MIAFGVAVSDRGKLERFALPGIDRAAECDSALLLREGHDSIQQPYNEMIEEAATLHEVEALVLLHQDLELTDASLARRLRRVLRDPRVGAVGALGWRGPDPHFWSGPGGGPSHAAPVGIRSGIGFDEGQTGDFHYGFGWAEEVQEVEMIDGVLIAVAPWALRAVRFDSRPGAGFHGYDADYSLRVRAAGGRLVCDPIPHIHHMTRLWRDREEYVESSLRAIRTWDPDVRPAEWAPAFQL